MVMGIQVYSFYTVSIDKDNWILQIFYCMFIEVYAPHLDNIKRA